MVKLNVYIEASTIFYVEDFDFFIDCKIILYKYKNSGNIEVLCQFC